MFSGIIGESPPRLGSSKPQKACGRRREPTAECHDDEAAPAYAVSMRHAFVPYEGTGNINHKGPSTTPMTLFLDPPTPDDAILVIKLVVNDRDSPLAFASHDLWMFPKCKIFLQE